MANEKGKYNHSILALFSKRYAKSTILSDLYENIHCTVIFFNKASLVRGVNPNKVLNDPSVRMLSYLST